MSYLADSNILLRLTQKTHQHYPIVKNAVINLRTQGEEICIVPQNLIEFWAVATRPVLSNGLGLTTTETQSEISKFRRLFKFYDDESDIFDKWENLVAKHQVLGKNVHDARLAAAMLKHNISHLLTLNIKDLKRFTEINVIDPHDI